MRLSSTKNSFRFIFSILLLVICSNFAFAHWNSKGPYGGTVKCFTVADTNLYVGSATGGVFRSINKDAKGWKAVNNGLLSGKINALTSIGNIVIAGTADKGIFYSNDLGANWLQATGLTNLKVLSLLTMGSNIFAGTDGSGVFISKDSGKTWEPANKTMENLSVTALSKSEDEKDIYAGTSTNGVYESEDNGATWFTMNTGLADLSVTTLAQSGSKTYAGTKNGLFVCNMDLDAWESFSEALSNQSVNGLLENQGNIYVSTDNGIFINIKGTDVWNLENTGLLTETSNTVAVFGAKLFAGTDRYGIFTSAASPVNWNENNFGFNNLNTSAMYASGSLVIAATERGVYVSRDIAANYVSANNGLTDSLHVNSLVFDLNNGLIAGTDAGLFRSVDTGRIWSQFGGLDVYSIKSINIMKGNVFQVATEDGKIFTSSTSGYSFVDASSNLGAGLQITSMVSNDSILFIGTAGNGIYKSSPYTTSNTFTWSQVNSGLSNLNVTSLVFKDSSIFTGTAGGGVFASTIENSEWVAVNDGLPSLNIQSLGTVGDYVLAGYQGGVIATLNNGENWYAPNTLLNIPPFTDVTGIAFTTLRIFISTPTNSLYSNAQSELPTGMLSASKQNKSSFSVYPNPNNGNFSINYKDLSSITDISIYDFTGNLIEHVTPAAKISLGKDYPKGVYFIHLSGKEGVSAEKMILN